MRALAQTKGYGLVRWRGAIYSRTDASGRMTVRALPLVTIPHIFEVSAPRRHRYSGQGVTASLGGLRRSMAGIVRTLSIP